jgi:prepilin-type N-terminal cleavage/methylation domain-containing protein
MTLKNRPGMSLAEMLIALTIFGILFAATLGFLDQQTRVFNKGTTQMEALQNLRYSLNTLEKDLVTVGSNLTAEQPFMVYADTHVVAFNADYSSNVPGDPYAVYVDTAMNDLMANAVLKANRFTIPRTSVMYPDTNYFAAGENSHAETIIFYFEPDLTTPRQDDYHLYRKVNNQTADLIARSMLKLPGKHFFEYYRRVTPPTGSAYLELIPTSQMPLRHSVALHGSPGDTAFHAWIDLIRAVKVNYQATDNSPAPNERVYAATRTIALPNAGQTVKKSCGDEPLLGTGINFQAQRVNIGGGRYAPRLTWNRATDEGGGERDVVRYVIYRTIGAPGPYTEPYLSIPAGNTSYTYTDTDTTPLVSYYYAIAVQDCTPSLSSILPYPSPITP